jgi:hypothetical protein
MLPSSHLTGDSRTNSSLGGGSLAYTATTGEALGAGVPPDPIPTTVEDHPSRSLIAGFPSVVSNAVSGQIGFLSSCRSRRMKPRHKWCTVARAWVLSSRRPQCPSGFVRLDRDEVEGKLPSHRILDGRSRLQQK